MPDHPNDDSQWRGAGTLLLVDDDAAVRLVVCQVLESRGFDVESVGDGQSALESFGTSPERFVGVLLDLVLPDLDGREVLRRLVEMDSGVRVVLMSGYPNPGGSHLFLQKPFGAEELEEAVRRCLEV